MILVILSVFALFVNMDILRALPQGFAEIFRSFPDAFGVPAGVGIPLYLLLFIINSISGILIVYMCIAIGHSFNTHKILASVGVYVGMILVNNLISMIFSAVTGMISYGSSSVFIGTANNVPNAANFWLSWSFAMLLCLVTAAAGYLLSNYFMTKRLNLSNTKRPPKINPEKLSNKRETAENPCLPARGFTAARRQGFLSAAPRSIF